MESCDYQDKDLQFDFVFLREPVRREEHWGCMLSVDRGLFSSSGDFNEPSSKLSFERNSFPNVL